MPIGPLYVQDLLLRIHTLAMHPNTGVQAVPQLGQPTQSLGQKALLAATIVTQPDVRELHVLAIRILNPDQAGLILLLQKSRLKWQADQISAIRLCHFVQTNDLVFRLRNDLRIGKRANSPPSGVRVQKDRTDCRSRELHFKTVIGISF